MFLTMEKTLISPNGETNQLLFIETEQMKTISLMSQDGD